MAGRHAVGSSLPDNGAGRARTVEHLALAAVELAEMAARQRRPEHAVAIDVGAATAVARHRRRIDFGELRLRVEAHGVARPRTERLAPDRAVLRIDHHAVETDRDALVLLRIDGGIRLDPVVAPAVAVGVEHERRPALRALMVAGFFQHPAIDPTGHARTGAAARQPQRIVGVLGEDQVMGWEAGIDQRELAGRRSNIDTCRAALSIGNTLADG